MKVEAEKNQRLIRQYPFILDILSETMEPYASLGGKIKEVTHVDDLTINIEKADGDLMFRQANNVGLGDLSFVSSRKSNRENQIMRQGEYFFAINCEGKIVNRVNWPRNDEEWVNVSAARGETYGWSVFWTGQSTFPSGNPCFTNPIWDSVNYLVWVTVKAWYHVENDNFRFHDRLVQVTIYKKPDRGFEKLQKEADVYTNLCLNTGMMMRGMFNKNYDIMSIGGMLYEMCITFQDEVYFNGMKAILDGGEFRGAFGQFGSVKVLAAKTCGYDRVMLEDFASYITFQLRPNSRHMYVLGQQGTLPQIRNLVRTVTRMWNQNPELRAVFKPSKNVSVV